MKPHIRIIGDVHGLVKGRSSNPFSGAGRCYGNLIAKPKYSIQVGDFSSFPGWLDKHDIDSNHHKIVAGNHDIFNALTDHFFTGYGFHSFPLASGEFQFFYAHGAYSVDRKSFHQVHGVTLFDEEEMNWEKLYELIEDFPKMKPKIVVSHDCPAMLIPYVGSSHWAARGNTGSRTANALQQCFDSWQPEMWFFGHYHKKFSETINGTKFFCLDELNYMDFDKNGHLLHKMPQ